MPAWIRSLTKKCRSQPLTIGIVMLTFTFLIIHFQATSKETLENHTTKQPSHSTDVRDKRDGIARTFFSDKKLTPSPNHLNISTLSLAFSLTTEDNSFFENGTFPATKHQYNASNDQLNFKGNQGDSVLDNVNKTQQAADRQEVFHHWDNQLEPPDPSQQKVLSSAWLKKMERVFKQRKRTMEAACQHYNVVAKENGGDAWRFSNKSRLIQSDLFQEIVTPSHFTVLPQLKTMLCLVNKVASTFLLGTFLKLAGHGVPVYESGLQSPHANAKLLRVQDSAALESARQHYFKFLFVRHPLQRLISAYEDKVKIKKYPSQENLRQDIFSWHENNVIRDQAADLVERDKHRVREVTIRYNRQVADYRADVLRRNNTPSFQEFLDFVLHGELTGDSFDSHWTPYWRQCSPCHINYDVIGKLDTAADDFTYIWHQLGILSQVRIPGQHQRQSLALTLPDRIRTYLSPIRNNTVRLLRRHFRLDFEMFGYDWRWMLEVSGHCRPGIPCELACDNAVDQGC